MQESDIHRIASDLVVRGLDGASEDDLLDLCGYTTISDSAEPDEIVPLLNDYSEAGRTLSN